MEFAYSSDRRKKTALWLPVIQEEWQQVKPDPVAPRRLITTKAPYMEVWDRFKPKVGANGIRPVFMFAQTYGIMQNVNRAYMGEYHSPLRTWIKYA